MHWHRTTLYCLLDTFMSDIQSVEITHKQVWVASEHFLDSVSNMFYHLRIAEFQRNI